MCSRKALIGLDADGILRGVKAEGHFDSMAINPPVISTCIDNTAIPLPVTKPPDIITHTI